MEIDRDANRILQKHWPEVTKFGDITQLDPADLDPVDVICGGSPCQNLSVAGSREGLAGSESRLFFDFVRICDAFSDAWVVWENVPGVFSTHGGEDFSIVLRELTGYWPAVPPGGWGTEGGCIGPKRTVAWAVLDAQWFGVAQRRRRVFVVGHSRNRAGPYEILLEPDSLRGDSPPRRQAGSAVATLLASGAGTSRVNQRDLTGGAVVQALTGTYGKGGPDDNKAQGGFLVPEVTYTLRACPGGTGQGHNTNYIVESTARTLTANYGKQVDSSDTNAGPPNVVVEDVAQTLTSQHSPTDAGRGIPLVTHTLRAEGADASEDGTGRGTPIILQPNSNLETSGDMALSLVASGGSGSRQAVWFQAMAVRRLLPVECERLQGLPDDWTRWDAEGRELSDSARYRLVGNAVAVPVVRWIATRLRRVMEGEQLF